MAVIDWGTVATALATAGAMTMTVQYFAKPRLDVRTHRTVEMVRVRQQLVESLISIYTSASSAAEPLPEDLDDEVRATFAAEQERQYGRMQEACRDLFDNAGKYVAAYPGKGNRTLIQNGIETLYGVAVMSPPTRPRQVETVTEVAQALAEFAAARRVIMDAYQAVHAAMRLRGLVAEAQRRDARQVAPSEERSSEVPRTPTATGS